MENVSIGDERWRIKDTHPRANPLFLYHHHATNAVTANGKNRTVSQNNVPRPLIPGQRCRVP